MFNNGNNGGGNPNHAADGKFTSGPNQAGQGGNKIEPKKSYEDQIKEKLGVKNDANPSYEEKVQSVMGIKKPEAQDNPFDKAKSDLKKYGETIVGEDGDRVFSVTTDGTKYYGISYRTNYNGPIDGTEEEYDSGYDTLEEAVAAMEKDGYPIYDDLKENGSNDSEIVQQFNDAMNEKEKDSESPKKRYIKKDGMIIIVDENGKPTGEQYPNKENVEDINTTLNGWEEIEEKR